MATRQENLQTALDEIAERLAEITTSSKPSYSIDGESISWNEYRSGLIMDMIELEKALQRASGPFEVRSRGV